MTARRHRSSIINDHVLKRSFSQEKLPEKRHLREIPFEKGAITSAGKAFDRSVQATMSINQLLRVWKQCPGKDTKADPDGLDRSNGPLTESAGWLRLGPNRADEFDWRSASKRNWRELDLSRFRAAAWLVQATPGRSSIQSRGSVFRTPWKSAVLQPIERLTQGRTDYD